MLSNKLKQLRNITHLTQSEFAKKIDVARTTYAMYEQGNREPDYETLKRIAKFHGVTTDYLLGTSEDKNPKSLTNEETALYKQAGISDIEYNNLDAYQKEVIDFFVSREKLAFKNQPENILDALEQFEIFYEFWKKQQEKKK